MHQTRLRAALQVVSTAAPAQGSGLPLLAARLCFLLLLVPPAAWDAVPDEQVATALAGSCTAPRHRMFSVPWVVVQSRPAQMQAACVRGVQ